MLALNFPALCFREGVCFGGDGGIRTHGAVFQTLHLSKMVQSATLPHLLSFLCSQGFQFTTISPTVGGEKRSAVRTNQS